MNDPEPTLETKTEHTYYFYGKLIHGYGPSMDPHKCGDPNEPCETITYQRSVTPWAETGCLSRGNDEPSI